MVAVASGESLSRCHALVHATYRQFADECCFEPGQADRHARTRMRSQPVKCTHLVDSTSMSAQRNVLGFDGVVVVVELDDGDCV